MSITNQLSLFLDVVQQGSFSKAAALHDMDNSSLSKQIKKLETSLGVQLLNRSTRSFSLTPAGEEILNQAQQLIDTLNNIHNIADSYQSTPKGTIRITSPVFLGQEYLQPVISRFMQKYPDVKVTLSLDDKMADIIADHYDLAFRIGKLEESNLIAKKIANTHFAVIASKAFIEKHGTPTTPETLAELPAVVYSNADTTLDQMWMSDKPHGDNFKTYKMKGNYKVSDVRMMVAGVRDGLGYAVIDLYNLNQNIEEQGIVTLLTDYVISSKDRAVYAVYPHRKQTPLVREFIQAFQDDIGDPPRWVNHVPNYASLYR
ncbi:LysR family transcriptional regulator [Photobacterium gaetbulicola]|uniref:LysR family transcriptional regulator n=1 Tax=Photobacterium gaetbulicola TaxID=1295392 RepID=A0A0B9GX14_9GAMM|nr:LysR family transcriptional regulator [Photobacterium gaetbulicola]KHT63241.1 LysR family transcriptional regulator [Photobacterium gaetbulicola]